MSQVIQFPSGSTLTVKSIAEGTREGLLESGMSAREVAEVVPYIERAWKGIAEAADERRSIEMAAHRELLLLAIKIVRGEK